jgi:hypothetical protein
MFEQRALICSANGSFTMRILWASSLVVVRELGLLLKK